MENFNTVPDKGTFGGSVEVVNQNFLLAQQEMDVLQNKCENESARAIEAENSLRQLYNNLQQSQPIPVTQLPTTGEAGKIYRLAGTTSYADYMYNENDLTTPIKMAEYDNAIDDKPTPDSDNIVKSGGVYNFKDVFSNKNQKNDELSVVDTQGWRLARFAEGEFTTKNFASKVAPQLKRLEETNTNVFLCQDENGNTVLAIKYGHIITKYFNSQKVNPWAGKNICIIGDSITELNWYTSVLAEELECNVYNRGWSGVGIAPMSTLGGLKSYAFTHRFDEPDNNELGNGNLTIEHSGTPSTELVDLMIIYGGTNDWGHGYIGETSSSYCPIKLGSFSEPMSDTANTPSEAGASFYAALKYTCYRAKLKYPNVPLALCTLLPSLGYYDGANRSSEYVVNADMSVTLKQKEFLDGMKTKADFNNAIREVAKQFGAYVIDLDKMLGFPDYSQAMAELYYNNGDMTHPSLDFGSKILGKFIANQIRNNIIITK